MGRSVEQPLRPDTPAGLAKSSLLLMHELVKNENHASTSQKSFARECLDTKLDFVLGFNPEPSRPSR